MKRFPTLRKRRRRTPDPQSPRRPPGTPRTSTAAIVAYGVLITLGCAWSALDGNWWLTAYVVVLMPLAWWSHRRRQQRRVERLRELEARTAKRKRAAQRTLE